MRLSRIRRKSSSAISVWILPIRLSPFRPMYASQNEGRGNRCANINGLAGYKPGRWKKQEDG